VIRVVEEKLANVTADAVVRAIRSDLAPVNAESRDLALAAGDAVEERLQKSGRLPLGGAVITPGGDLPSDFLIHVVVMSEDEPQTSTTVQKALKNGLRRASDWALESLAVPPLGIGVGLIEPEVSARALVEILFDHVGEGEPPLDLKIAVSSPYEVELFRRLVDELSRSRSHE
jgi:O-acetyl-ADP-ribose deacetylase